MSASVSTRNCTTNEGQSEWSIVGSVLFFRIDLVTRPLCLHTATRVYQCETVFARLTKYMQKNIHTLRCAGVYTIMADFFPSKRRASDPYMVTVRRLAYALQRVTHPTCSPVATRSPSVLFSCLYPQYLGVYVCDSRIDFSPSQLRTSRVGLRHTHHPAKGRENTYHWPAILANRNFVNDVTSAKVGAQNHRAVGNAADVGW
ncbi:uncharacterized protein LOC100871596 [Apis florea]|uniref:uncharacterized protein LOC100871596 n=1 Tax=Apis florea TaxID=7463 RepID=UPI0012FEE9B2|nr:uncharacterized protein LOC100871596 [Apis florea]